MTDQIEAIDPLLEARTEAAQILAAIGSTAADAQQSLPGIATTDDDLDPIAKAAANINQQRRARGRPAGSANKRNEEVFEYLEARGFKAPELRLMEIISADPLQLARQLLNTTNAATMPEIGLVMDLIRLQAKCAADLMPYKFAKRQELKVDHSHKAVHVFVAGQLNTDTSAATLFNDINADPMRDITKASHDPDIA